MNQNIHPTAIVAPEAIIAPTAIIGPYCILGPDVNLGERVRLISHVYIEGRTIIGEGTVVYPFASLGTPPQDLKYAGEKSELIIGKNNTIREHTTMNPGTQHGSMKTIVGDNCLFMMATHVAHDCIVGNNVIMANNAAIAGHVQIGDYAVLGGLCAVHQFVRIGPHAIIGGMSGVENDVIPFGRVKGERAFLAGLNLIGLERRGFGKDKIKNLQRAFNQLFGEEGTFEQRLENVANDYGDDELVKSVLSFAREKTKFPLCQPQKK
ncbi:MAG: acyl-ACP--UDP-N-acetylglucosamine O-acyltransferase [Alphaproteobacteria bacterium]|nr:acyl-ACP--UDP-N-acetylglucosamine O-acyltransferase [Alphaproteobacteria bacterium]MBP7757750.1 acyl-ACP--UDP-N-acetylglucosamine O-acyltransferase [Alphaproteobacteria bacterium]MBP7761050.1 acyl-ACP--UDP-N-acetylglucosamine O-acyltransferase [Alphaproteobacteria bacterium]MBP7904576.1 acyl-ACP--UDP-N-acetylglucosamine O-acyltransferase [Alphaproteobacteria bacterium]